MNKVAIQSADYAHTPARNERSSGENRQGGRNDLESGGRAGPTTSLIVAAVVIELSFLLIHRAQTDAAQVGLMLVAYAISGAVFIWLVLTLENVTESRPSGVTLVIVFGAAIVFRATLLPLSPASSTDVNRYLWEGVVQTEGFNPYTTPPGAEVLADIALAHDDVFRRVNHPSIPTIYPPVAQFLFWLNAMVFGGSLFGWKMILLAFDVLLTVAAWKLLRAWRRPIWFLCFVLWCPLLLLETYEGGHLDLIGAALIVIALLAQQRARPLWVGIALGLAFNVKYLWPVLVMVLLVFQVEPGASASVRERAGARRDRVKTVVAAAVVAAACWIPYWSSIPAALATVRTYAETWRFNGAVFDLLRMLPGPSWLPMALVMVTLVSLTVLLARRPVGDSWSDTWLAFGAALLLLPAVFPWYFVWLVPGLLICGFQAPGAPVSGVHISEYLRRPPRWLLVWICVVPMLHVVDWQHRATGEWQPMQWLCIIVGIVPVALLVMAWWRRLAARYET